MRADQTVRVDVVPRARAALEDGGAATGHNCQHAERRQRRQPYLTSEPFHVSTAYLGATLNSTEITDDSPEAKQAMTGWPRLLDGAIASGCW
jgi:hypothetical protein